MNRLANLTAADLQPQSNNETSNTQDQTTEFDYGTWRMQEDQRLAAEQERQRVNQALATMEGFFQANGLMALWSGVRGYVEQGYNNADTIMQILSTDRNYEQAYMQRFPAVKEMRALNAQRAAQGLPPRPEPSAAAYIELEAGYRQALSSLPDNGIWGTSQDITDWIVNEVSPQELVDRVTLAENYLYFDSNQYVRKALREMYGMTDAEMIEYVLDPERAGPELQAQYDRRVLQSNVTGAARSQSVGLSDLLRDEIADTQFGATFDMASNQFNTVANETKAYERLGALARQEVSQEDLVKEAFGLSGAVQAEQKKNRLASQERARFRGSSGVGTSALSTKTAR